MDPAAPLPPPAAASSTLGLLLHSAGGSSSSAALKGEQGPTSLDPAAAGLHGTRRRRLGGDGKLLDLHRTTPRAGRAGGGGTRELPAAGRRARAPSLLLLRCLPEGASAWWVPAALSLAAPPRPPSSLCDGSSSAWWATAARHPHLRPASTSTFPRRRHRPLLPRLPTARGSQLPRGDARGEALHRCSPSSFARRDGLHTGLFCRSATGTCWSRSKRVIPVLSRGMEGSGEEIQSSCADSAVPPSQCVDCKRVLWKKPVREGRCGPDFKVAPAEESAVMKAIRTAGTRNGEAMFQPSVGMIFNSMEEAKEFYNLYSWERGFGVRFGRDRKNDGLYRTKQDLICSCEGFNRAQNCSTIRIGCMARVRLLRTKDHGWYVSSIIDEHNHRLSESFGENKQ